MIIGDIVLSVSQIMCIKNKINLFPTQNKFKYLHTHVIFNQSLLY